ncbi:MAG: hypothetical protein KVP17_000962 [Porospora cf. gigantea B]|uniref:uncharacterized protein n=1 Tax=Porospora cf. gigantea B TaxID=2853592 RepID=UPI003571A1D1|nr:MAG: hypothetical protein KVP17_000962 [Porospora cf. gigantea B]
MNPDLIRQVALLRVCPEIQVASLPAPDTTSGRAVVVARALQRALAGERPAPVAVEPLLSQMPLTDSESQVVRMISDLSKPNVETAVLRVASRRQDGLRIEELLQLRRSGLGISLLELYLRVMHSRSVAVPFVDLPDVCVGEDFCAVNQLFGLDLAEPRLARCLLMRRQNRSSKGPPLLQSEEQARLWKLCEDDLGDSEGEAPCDALRRVFPQEEGWQFEVLCDKGLPRRRFRASCVVSDVVPALVTFRWQHHTALIYLVSNFPELTCIPCREQDLLYVAARFCPTSRIQLLAAGASLHGCPWRRHPTESLVICSPAPLAWVCLRALASDPDAVRKVKTMLTLPESMHLIFDPALPLLGAAGGVASLCMNLDEVTRQLALDNLPQGPSVPPGLRFVLTETFEPFPDAPHVNFWAAAWLRVRSGQTRMSREDLVLSYVLERPAPDVASAALVLSDVLRVLLWNSQALFDVAIHTSKSNVPFPRWICSVVRRLLSHCPGSIPDLCVRITGKPCAGVLAAPSVALGHLRTVVFSQKLSSHEQADDLVNALVNVFLQVACRFRFLPQLIPSAYFQFEAAHSGPVEELCACIFNLWCLVPKLLQDLEPSCITAVSLPLSALVSECYLLNHSCKDCRERLSFMWNVLHQRCKGSIMITREVLSQMESGSHARRVALQWACAPPDPRASSLCVLPYLAVLLRLLEAADVYGSPEAFAIHTEPLRLFLSETRRQSTVRPIVTLCTILETRMGSPTCILTHVDAVALPEPRPRSVMAVVRHLVESLAPVHDNSVRRALLGFLHSVRDNSAFEVVSLSPGALALAQRARGTSRVEPPARDESPAEAVVRELAVCLPVAEGELVCALATAFSGTSKKWVVVTWCLVALVCQRPVAAAVERARQAWKRLPPCVDVVEIFRCSRLLVRHEAYADLQFAVDDTAAIVKAAALSGAWAVVSFLLNQRALTLFHRAQKTQPDVQLAMQECMQGQEDASLLIRAETELESALSGASSVACETTMAPNLIAEVEEAAMRGSKLHVALSLVKSRAVTLCETDYESQWVLAGATHQYATNNVGCLDVLRQVSQLAKHSNLPLLAMTTAVLAAKEGVATADEAATVEWASGRGDLGVLEAQFRLYQKQEVLDSPGLLGEEIYHQYERQAISLEEASDRLCQVLSQGVEVASRNIHLLGVTSESSRKDYAEFVVRSRLGTVLLDGIFTQRLASGSLEDMARVLAEACAFAPDASRPTLDGSSRLLLMKLLALLQSTSQHPGWATRLVPHYLKVSATQWFLLFQPLVALALNETLSCVVRPLLSRLLAEYPHQAVWHLSTLILWDSEKNVDPDTQRVWKEIESGAATIRGEENQQHLNDFSVVATFLAEIHLGALAEFRRSKTRQGGAVNTHLKTTLDACCPQAKRLINANAGKVIVPTRCQLCLPRKSGFVWLKGIRDEVLVISSLTKPVKVALLGSDGKTYHRLIKCEAAGDFRKDARVMEIAAVVNVMLRGETISEPLNTYGIWALNKTVGLVEWVTDLKPLIAFIKNQKDSIIVHNGKGGRSIARNIHQLRKFAVKVAPQLPAAFADTFDSSLDNWAVARRNFEHTVAAWSMFGYLLGLGDRHMGNVNIDVRSGRCMHIDFDCLHEKGRQLCVSEEVPFRLTREMALTIGVARWPAFQTLCGRILERLRRRSEELSWLMQTAFGEDLLHLTNDRGAFHLHVVKRKLQGFVNYHRPNPQQDYGLADSEYRKRLQEWSTQERTPVQQACHLLDVSLAVENLSLMYGPWRPQF